MNEKGQYWTILFPFFLYWRLVFPSTVDHQWRSLGRTATPSVGTSNVGSASTIFFVSKCPLDLHIRRRVGRCFFFCFFFGIFLKFFESTPSIGGCGHELFCVADGFARWLIIQIIHIWRMICENCEKLERFSIFWNFFISAICRVTAELNSWFA